MMLTEMILKRLSPEGRHSVHKYAVSETFCALMIIMLMALSLSPPIFIPHNLPISIIGPDFQADENTLMSTESGYTGSEVGVSEAWGRDQVALFNMILTLRVVVYDVETGDRLQGAKVIVRGSPTTLITKETDQSGEAVFQLDAGGYEVIAEKTGYRFARKIVNLQERLIIRMPLFRITQNITVTVTVNDSKTSNPIQGVTIFFEDGAMIFTARTNIQGIAMLEIPIGGYTMRVTVDGYHPFTRTIYLSNDVEIPISLAPVTEPVEPPIPPGEDDVAPTTFRITDIIAGTRIAGAKVILTRGPYVYETTTSENGEATFKISNGLYSYRVEHPNYFPIEGSMFVVKGLIYELQMTPLASIKRAKLTVYAIDSAKQTPIEGAEVTISNASASVVKFTDKQGKAEFILTAGGYSIRVVKHPDPNDPYTLYYPYFSEFRFPANRDAEYIVSLDPYVGRWVPPGSNCTDPAPIGYAWYVVGVRFKDGTPFPGASVKIYDTTNNQLIGERVSDGEGWARFLLRHNKLYRLELSATYRGQSVSISYTFNASASYLVFIRLPWYSNFTKPEVGVTDVAFMNRIGLWDEEQVVLFNILSTVDQRITLAVEAINYTAYLQGREQVLASTTLQMNITVGENKGWAALKIDGGGWTYVAPRVRIISYQDDVHPDNNERIGPAISFNPLVDLHVTLFAYIMEYKVPARYPELTKYRVCLKVVSDYDLPGVGVAEINYTWVSAYTMQTEIVSRSWEVPVKRGVNWINDTLILPWTDVVVIKAFFRHPHEIIWADNYQEYRLELDPAIKILNVTHPWVVTSGDEFTVKVTVISNKKAEHPMFVNINYYGSPEKFAIIPFGISEWTISARAPRLLEQAGPQEHKMIVVAGIDHYPADNRYEAYVMIMPEKRESEDFKPLKNSILILLMISIIITLIAIICFIYAIHKRRQYSWQYWAGELGVK